MRKKRPDLTEAEWTLIKAVWTSEPCTAPQIQQKVASKTNWTYSTVRTLLDRMTAKGLLTSKKVGKMTFYCSAVTRKDAQRNELLYALKHAFNGSMGPMVQCLLETGDLSADDLSELEALIKSKKKGHTK